MTLIGAGLVAWWCVAMDVIRMDSPFASPSFGVYFLFALAGELLIGLPYGLGIRAVLRRLGRWTLPMMLVAAALPGVLLLLFDDPLGGLGRLFGPCTLIAALVMATGWHILGYDADAGAQAAARPWGAGLK